jgi:hypothetical protein
MDLPAHSGPRPLIQFRNHFSQTVGLLGRVISTSQGRYLHTGQHKHRIDAYTHTLNIHVLSGIRTHDPSVRASEDSSSLKVPIHVRVWLGSGPNEPNSSVCGAPRAGLGRVQLGSPGPSVGLGSLLARTCVGGPEPGSEPCRLPCLKRSWAQIFWQSS